MLNFLNDYSEGCFPEILEDMNRINFLKQAGYGTDTICKSAADRIRKYCGKEDAQVYFMSGGTQTNQIVVDALLDSFDGVISAATGHVAVHEAGAIEYTGHKVFQLEHREGKLLAEQIRQFLKDYYADDNHEHMVRPGMVYLSHPTELGTLYTKEELTNIHGVCEEYHIPLYLDGARLASALTARDNDLTLQDIAALTDVFYIGGTKCGALLGEALVWTHNNMPFRFSTRVKQHGAMLAKGWVQGQPFDVLFRAEDGKLESTLYIKGGRHANRMADLIRAALKEKGYSFYVESATNQIFLIADQEDMEKLSQFVVFSFFEKYDAEHSVIRLVTSWATREEDVQTLIQEL